MKCTSKFTKLIVISLITSLFLSGCGQAEYAFPYTYDYKVGCFDLDVGEKSEKLDTFAKDLCIVNENYLNGLEAVVTEPEAAGLFSIDDQTVMFAKNVHLQLNPASLTKVMTAIVALKYGNLEDIVVVGDEINNLDPGAQRCGLKEGDKVTLSQLMYVLLIWSANDAAMTIAKHVGGTPEDFMNLMNEEARKIGAVNCHFMNPHGLTEENHYVTLYDMYLIFNEALNYDVFKEIIQLPSYKSVYQDADGKDKYFDYLSTNMYLRGDYEAPEQVRIAGGKTGTTFAAGNCLIVYAIDNSNKSYISIMMHAEDKEKMYTQMSELLKEIDK